MASNHLPPSWILVRSRQGVELFKVPERSDDVVESRNERKFVAKGSTSLLQAAPDGSCAYLLLVGHGIVKCPLDESSKEPITKENTTPFLEKSQGVQMLDLSPKGTYLLTWERWSEDKVPNNLKVWEAATGKLLAAFPQKSLKREAWPYLQWTHDEAYAFLMASNEIRIYPAENFDSDEVRYTDKLRINGITAMSLPRTCNNKLEYLFTSFCPGTKDKPARANLHEYKPGSAAVKAPSYPALLSKSLFQAEEMKTHWSPIGDAALITLQTSVDASGQSYYGSSQLFLLAQHVPDVTAVPLPQEGPVHAVQWMPNPDKPPCFVVVAGKMPAMASLHHGQTSKPTFLFGNAHRNTIAWAPHGRFVCIAGFGNLAGGMSFWDRNKCKLIPHVASNRNGNLRAEAVVGHGWSPDSRLFAVSTCAPRMNVDNGVRLFRYTGEELLKVPWNNEDYRPDQLLEACFVPAQVSVYPDRPQTPPPEEVEASSEASSNNQKAPPVAASKPAGRYVPPSARNRAGGSSLAERMRREKEGNLQGATKVKPMATSVTTGKVIPGLAEPTKTKSAIKRDKQKLKQKQQEEEAKKKAELEKQELQQQVDPEKRARKVKKLLNQIDELKQKDPGELNDDQKAKIESESSLRAELEKLGV